MIRASATLLAMCALSTVAGVPAAGAQTPAEVFRGSLPARGGVALVSLPWPTPTQVLLEAAIAQDCDVTALAVARHGSMQTYVPRAPSFVNAAFPANLPAGALVAIRCARPRSEVPDVELLRLVTKVHALPSDLVPETLTLLPSEIVIAGGGSSFLAAAALDALEEMLEAARSAGHDIRVRSAYRSYAEQVTTHEYWTNALGEEEAARRSARPGHSEHQLGVAVDLTSASVGWELEPEFGETAEGRWLSLNARRFGFVESYPDGAEEITGYRYEPWHLRYIGRTHAEWLRQSGLTLTAYLTAMQAELE